MVAPFVAIGGAAVIYAGYKYLGEEKSESDQDQVSSESINSDASGDISSGLESSEVDQSSEAHREAIDREPPVEVGKRYRVFLEEEIATDDQGSKFKSRYEGFWVFVEAHAEDVEVDDVVTVKITAISDEGNAAQAKYVPEP